MIIIDASMLFRRCLAKMDFLKNGSNMPTGLEFGTLRTVESLEKHYPNQRIVFVYDSPTATQIKQKVYSEYKNNRNKMGDTFYQRINKFKAFLNNFYDSAEQLNFEADDLMYSIANALRYTEPHFIYTNDADLLQCVDDHKQIKVVRSFMSKLYEWDEAQVIKEYGVIPKLLPILRAFTGDASDNLPGVPRINKKYLAKLIMWAHHTNIIDDMPKFLQELKIADWSAKMFQALTEHIDSGQWAKNYSLMQLKQIVFAMHEPLLDEDYVINQLKEWEIYSLKLCVPFKQQLCNYKLSNEEF